MTLTDGAKTAKFQNRNFLFKCARWSMYRLNQATRLFRLLFGMSVPASASRATISVFLVRVRFGPVLLSDPCFPAVDLRVDFVARFFGPAGFRGCLCVFRVVFFLAMRPFYIKPDSYYMRNIDFLEPELALKGPE